MVGGKFLKWSPAVSIRPRRADSLMLVFASSRMEVMIAIGSAACSRAERHVFTSIMSKGSHKVLVTYVSIVRVATAYVIHAPTQFLPFKFGIGDAMYMADRERIVLLNNNVSRAHYRNSGAVSFLRKGKLKSFRSVLQCQGRV
jgi:hypothetical protein